MHLCRKRLLKWSLSCWQLGPTLTKWTMLDLLHCILSVDFVLVR